MRTVASSTAASARSARAAPCHRSVAAPSGRGPTPGPTTPPAQQQQQAQPRPRSDDRRAEPEEGLCRRSMMARAGAAAVAAAVATAVGGVPPAEAYTPPPPGFRAQVDKIDGYRFFYPESWIPVTSSGNDVFLRNPRNIDENIFVDISSPSSSRFNSVTDLGTPDEAAIKLLDKYLVQEFMSTRIGIKREGKVMSAVTREGADGRTYYDITMRVTSYGSRNAYVATQEEVLRDYGVEWDRVLCTTLGTANMRLYELRFQTAASTYQKSLPAIERVATSFGVSEVDPSVNAPQLPSSLRAL